MQFSHQRFRRVYRLRAGEDRDAVQLLAHGVYQVNYCDDVSFSTYLYTDLDIGVRLAQLPSQRQYEVEYRTGLGLNPLYL